MSEFVDPNLVKQRILSSVTRDPDGGCWIWNRQISNSGYGRLMVRTADGSQTVSAHRASYAVFRGDLPDDAMPVQTCGNRLCVNPEHLQLQR